MLPYNIWYNIFVGTGVLDCPFGSKCYFMPTRVAEDVDPYGKKTSSHTSHAVILGRGIFYIIPINIK